MKTTRITAISAWLLSAALCAVWGAAPTDYREAPLRTLATDQTWTVSDFGAFADDDLDDRTAIQNALTALASADVSTTLEFEPGKYLLGSTNESPSAMLVAENLTNAVLELNGAELVVRSPLSGFLKLLHCENIIVRNGTVDYDPAPHTEGIIQAVDEDSGTIDVEIREGFPAPDLDYFEQAPACWGYLLDPAVPGRLKTGAGNYIGCSSVERVTNSLFRLTVPETTSWTNIEQGDRFALLARGYGSLFYSSYSRQITAENLTSYNTPAGHYVSVMTEALNVLGCSSLIKSGFWKGGNADGVHCQTSRVGPWVEDCIFEGISDDSLVIYTRPYSVVEQLSQTRFQIVRYSSENTGVSLYDGELQVGDVLDFLSPVDGVVFGTATVTAYDADEGIISLDSPVSGVDPGIYKAKTQIWNRSIGKGFVMKDNILRNSRRYGIYLKASDGLISGNRLAGLSSCAMALQNDPGVPNGPFCRNIDIVNNTIDYCGFDTGFLKYADIGTIRVTSRRLDFGDALSGVVHSNILIEGNSFNNLLRSPISLSNVDGSLIQNNRLDGVVMTTNDVIVRTCQNIEVFGQEFFMALTDSYTVEIFDNFGTKTSTIALTGSGAAAGTNLISAAVGNLRGNGNELIVLRDSGQLEYYGDPLTASNSLSRCTFQPLERGGRAVSAISMVAGGSRLVACANPDVNPGTYGYEYDGSMEGAYLDRITTLSLSVYGRHYPYVSLVAGDDLHGASGLDWVCLGSDGWVEIFTEQESAGSAAERVAYFNAGSAAKEITVAADDRYAVLYSDHTVKFFSLDGVQNGAPITLDTTSTLAGFVLTGEPATDLFQVWSSSFGSIGSATDDFDADGFDNLYEYASNGNPTNEANSGYPVVMQIVEADSATWFEYVYARRITAGSGLTYTLLQNMDLVGGSWTSTGDAVEVGTAVLDDDFELVTNRIPIAGKTREFIRHQISQ